MPFCLVEGYFKFIDFLLLRTVTKYIVKDWFTDLHWKGNIYVVLLFRLLIALALFTVCRIAFFVFNASYFPEVTLPGLTRILLGGLRFDLTAVLYLNALVIVLMIFPVQLRFHRMYQRAVKYVFLIMNGAALAMNVSDTIYYRFTLRRTTADIFGQFENETNLAGLFGRFLIDYWYGVLFWLLLIWLLVWLYNRVSVEGPMIKNNWVHVGFGALALPIVIYLFIGGARGGFAHSTRPITLSNAGEYVQKPQEVSIVLNTPFAIFRTLGKTRIQKINYIQDPQELINRFNPVHVPSDTISFTPKNVVIIILESFSREFIGSLNRDRENYAGYTPFLDSLISHSLTFNYSFANGRKSIDGLPSVVASIPSLGVPYVLTPFSNNDINSLASVLGKKGYHTSFFHGAPNGSMGFKAFMNMAGVEQYFGKDEYERDVVDTEEHFDGMWGIWDDKFLKYYADQLNTFPQPFMSSLFTVSSHHPFRVPKEFEGVFKGGEEPILKCIEYTDYALREFFTTVSKASWYENTLFVITADHCSSNILFDESRTTWGMFSVPVIFFKPDRSLTERRDEIAQQIDIMPSVLGYLHYDQPYVAFGRDIFREQTEPFAFNFSSTYHLYKDDYLIIFDGEKVVNLFNFKTDKLLSQDLKETLPNQVSEMENQIKAIIQQYNNRMMDNRLLPE